MRKLTLLKIVMQKLVITVQVDLRTSVVNVHADRLSRRLLPDDLQLRIQVQHSVVAGMRAPRDVFKFRPTDEPLVYLIHASMAMELEVQCSKTELLLLCPPVELLGPIVRKLTRTQFLFLLLIPYCPRHPWHQSVIRIALIVCRLPIPSNRILDMQTIYQPILVSSTVIGDSSSSLTTTHLSRLLKCMHLVSFFDLLKYQPELGALKVSSVSILKYLSSVLQTHSLYTGTTLHDFKFVNIVLQSYRRCEEDQFPFYEVLCGVTATMMHKVRARFIYRGCGEFTIQRGRWFSPSSLTVCVIVRWSPWRSGKSRGKMAHLTPECQFWMGKQAAVNKSWYII